MSATLRDLAAPEPWRASLERSRARRKDAGRPATLMPLTGPPVGLPSDPDTGTPGSKALRRPVPAGIWRDPLRISAATPRLARVHGEPLRATGRDLAEAEPWELSLGRSRARRRACQLRFVPASTRARRISLGTLVALIAAPPASLGDASGHLGSAPAKPAAPPTTTTHEVRLSTGSESRQVRLLQKALGITVDGIYGPETEDAVLSYQASRGLIVDNIVGPETKAALAHHAPAVLSTREAQQASGTPAARVATAEDPHAPARAATDRGHGKHLARIAIVKRPHDPAGAGTDHDSGRHTATSARRLQAQDTLRAGGTAAPAQGALSARRNTTPTSTATSPAATPPASTPPAQAKLSLSDTGGTPAGAVSNDEGVKLAATAQPSPRQSPANHPARTIDAERYVNPLPGGFAAGRTDMGVDFTATPGAPILAIGDAKILGIYPNWFPPGGPNGGNLLEYELLNGPDAGRKVYVAEQIEITVHAGQTVNAGALIGRYAAAGTGIETGWAAGGGVTLAQASTGYQEGEETTAGKSFRGFLQSLGVGV